METVEGLLRSDGRVGTFLLRRSARPPQPRLALSFVARPSHPAIAPDVPRLAVVHHVSIEGTRGELFTLNILDNYASYYVVVGIYTIFHEPYLQLSDYCSGCFMR